MKEDRFWSKVDKTGSCWIWKACLLQAGYGQYAITRKHRVYAHRYAYEELKGKIPEGLHLDHLCRNPPCCNPDHLEAVTQKENCLRGLSVPAINARKTHCKHGHEFSDANTRRMGNGSRRCRECDRRDKRDNGARYKANRKARLAK